MIKLPFMKKFAAMTTKPAAHDFFSRAWEIYRLTIDHNYLWHRQAAEALDDQLRSRFSGARPIRFLDLACGDAFMTSQILQNYSLDRYVGVDRSDAALGYAAEYLQKLAGPVALHNADFLEYLEQSPDDFDGIYVGLSAHHLDESQLARLFQAVQRHLRPGGLFAAYEPFLLPDETHRQHFERFCAFLERDFHSMNAEQKQDVADHVGTMDFPRLLSQWDRWAAAAGLSPALRAYRSPDRLYELVIYHPEQSQRSLDR